MLTELMISSSSEKRVAIREAFSAATASSADPDSTSLPLAELTWMSVPGTLSRMVLARRSVSSVTSMSIVPTNCLFSSNRATPVVPRLLPRT
jgi:hypothetical protein